MRTITFRGLRVDGGGWTFGYLVPRIHRRKKQWWIVENIHYGALQGHQVSPETVGQFTGIPDKKGHAVYEGDIVKTRVSRPKAKKNPKYRNFQVVYNGSSFWNTFDSLLLQPYLIEVVGNVYEHPNLLGV